MELKYIIILLISLTFNDCSFQPNSADGIILLKEEKDVLYISIIDSYHVIKNYDTFNRNDTLFINILSISSPSNSSKPILIPIDSTINYVKLQNDTVYDIQLIPYSLNK
jgi:hypothetical protein